MKKQITLKEIEKAVDDVFYNDTINAGRNITLYAFGYMDDKGVVHCKALEDIDKAMKAKFKEDLDSGVYGTDSNRKGE